MNGNIIEPLETEGREFSSQPAGNTLPAKKIGKFKASRLIALESWNLLKKDKEMVAFPVLSAIASLLVIGIAGTIFFFLILNGDLEKAEAAENSSYGLQIIFIFIMYFLTTFITIFFETGIITIVMGRLNNQNLSFQDGLNKSISKINKILVWSLVAATVGTLLKLISDRSKILGKIVVSILGAAWSILTFFIAPILIAEDIPIKESLQKSAATIKKTWGETVIINVGAGLFFMILFLAGLIIFIATLFTMDATIIIMMAIAFFIYLILLVVISSTLNVIFKVVLYEYANSGRVPEGFSAEVISMAFKNNQKKSLNNI